MSNSSHVGTGVGSTVRTERHTIKRWGRWWVSEEEFLKYRERQVLRKRAKTAGYDYTQLDEFLEMEKATHGAIETARSREKWTQRELRRLKKKHGLGPRANRTHLKKVYERTGDEEVAAFLRILTTVTASDAEKLAHIRKLFMSDLNPYDILYQTALTVGIQLRKK